MYHKRALALVVAIVKDIIYGVILVQLYMLQDTEVIFLD